jgi:chemotaxis protein MotB
MRRRKKHEAPHENHERWLLSYADFITLLMIFFVIMYSMSNVDKEKYKQVASGFQKAMGGGGGANIIGVEGKVSIDESTPINTNIVEATEEQKLERVKEAVDSYLKSSGLADSVETKVEERGLVLSFKDSLFFDSGKAEIKPDQVKKLIEIGKLLNQPIINESYIRVEGHTDNVPMYSYLYKSNWDLSVIRASNVAQILINQSGIRPDRVSATGYGEFRPKADNKTADGRASNRRVDILIMNTKFNEVENNKK